MNRKQHLASAPGETVDFGQIYHFLFDTYAGIGVLVAASLIICIIVAAILEFRTRKTYVDRGDSDENDAWSIFGDDDEDDEDDDNDEEKTSS